MNLILYHLVSILILFYLFVGVCLYSHMQNNGLIENKINRTNRNKANKKPELAKENAYYLFIRSNQSFFCRFVLFLFFFSFVCFALFWFLNIVCESSLNYDICNGLSNILISYWNCLQTNLMSLNFINKCANVDMYNHTWNALTHIS